MEVQELLLPSETICAAGVQLRPMITPKSRHAHHVIGKKDFDAILAKICGTK